MAKKYSTVVSLRGPRPIPQKVIPLVKSSTNIMPPVKHSPEQSHSSQAPPRSLSMGNVARAAGIGIALVDETGRFQEANRLMCRLTGYDEITLKRRTLHEMISPEHLSESHDMFMELCLGLSEEFDLELRIVRSDKLHIWVHLTGNLIPGTRTMVVTMHDSSDYFDLLPDLEN